MSKYHIQNFSIYLEQIGEHWYEFGHYEYTGDDYDGDMARLAREPRNAELLERHGGLESDGAGLFQSVGFGDHELGRNATPATNLATAGIP